MRTMRIAAGDKFDELTSDIDDLKTTVEEIQVDPPADVDPASLDKVKAALEDASVAGDEVDNEREERAGPKSTE